MAAFDDKAVIEFLRRSYFAVDGLWFVRVEDEISYGEAMRLDEQVWEIMPKIQARKARQLLKIQTGSLADLALALWLRFAAEGCEYRVIERTPDVLRIEILTCPWLDGLRKSGRMQLAPDVCERICTIDYSGWAAEFSKDIEFSFECKLSEGAPGCIMRFARTCESETQPHPDEKREAAG
ncbi:MAG: DUF6125 family protein [Armatimonadetes bacterium]|nr:DUF6125 family protein [Armatimonadota bacterium]